MTDRSSQPMGAGDIIRAFYEVPLGLASFVFFKALRGLVVRTGRAAYHKSPEVFRRWNVLSAEVLSRPHQLSRYLVIAPRWNPHSAVGSAGPVPVKRELTIDQSEICEGVGYWFFGVHGFPSFRSAGYVSSLNQATAKDGKITFRLPPGDYYIGCRYYGWPGKVRYPAISIDGVQVISGVDMPGDMNDFYPMLHLRERAIYRAAHYHMYVMLKYRSLLSPAWVEQHLLPVGNEDTDYLYGAARAGQMLRFAIEPALLQDHRVFCTIYNTASLPVMFFELTEAESFSSALPCNGAYLVRVMRMSGTRRGDQQWRGACCCQVHQLLPTPATGQGGAHGLSRSA